MEFLDSWGIYGAQKKNDLTFFLWGQRVFGERETLFFILIWGGKGKKLKNG